MAAPPTGTVTLLFTDIEGSTRLLHDLGPEGYAEELSAHRRVLRTAFERYGGVEMDTQGDAFFVVFDRAPSAVEEAQAINAGLASGPIRIRMGLHTENSLVAEEGYVGDDVHWAARIAPRGTAAKSCCRRAPPSLCAIFARAAREPPAQGLSRPGFSLPTRRRQVSAAQDDCQYQSADTRFELPWQGRRALRGGRADRDDAAVASPGLGVRARPGSPSSLPVVFERSGSPTIATASSGSAGNASRSRSRARHDRPGNRRKVGLREDIADKQMLSLLDNFEQVVTAAGGLSVVLEICPNLSLLVTSREVLHIRGEVEYRLPALAETDSVLLFCERAQNEPSADIQQLCRRLDGLPLAIELAAARARMLSPGEVLARLSQRLDLLKGGRDRTQGSRRCEPRSNGVTTSFWSRSRCSSVGSRYLPATGRLRPLLPSSKRNRHAPVAL